MNKASKNELSVLVVDDDENIRLVLNKALEKEGYRVSTAKSGEEALSILQRSFFHVVISDIMMAEMNGIELLLQIKENLEIPRNIVTILKIWGRMLLLSSHVCLCQ